VSQGDAFLDGADTQLLSGDHIGMCKFCDNPRGKERFRPVLSALKRLADVASVNPGRLSIPQKDTKGIQDSAGTNCLIKDVQSGHGRQAALLKSLCTDEFHQYSSNISPTKGTGRWIEERAAFQAWRDRADHKLWIHSKPAAGKTYLAKHIINQVRTKGDAQVLECFLNGRWEKRNSCDAILRSTIHQLAKNDPALWAWAIDQPGVRQAADTTANWTREELVNLWPRIVARAASNGSGVAIVLDGFDEIRSEDQDDFLDCLEACENKLMGPLRRNLCIVVLSRWCSSLANASRGFVEYEIGEEQNSEDIRRTVEEELSTFAEQAQYSDEFKQALCDAITQGAQGIYLWATVMIADIAIQMPEQDQLERQLDQLPLSLAKLYDSIFRTIKSNPGNHGPQTRRVLLWVVFGLAPLTLQELNVGLALAELWEEGRGRRIDNELLKSRMIRPEIFKASLNRWCGQLLSFSSSNHVKPVHRTLIQYLTTHPQTFKDRDWVVPHHASFHLSEQTAHRDLGSMCAAYLMMPSFECSGERFTATDEGRARWKVKVQARIDAHDLVKYSALCWSKHVSLAGSAQRAGDHDSHNCATLRDITTDFAISWYEVWWFATKWRDFEFPGRSGLERNIEIEESESINLRLHRAAQGGHVEVVRVLLQHGSDANWKDGEGKMVLVRAIEAGQDEAASVLLEVAGVDTSVRDSNSTTLLALASQQGMIRTVRLLLALGKADPGAVDKSGHTALSLAAEQGHEQIVQELLQSGRVSLKPSGGAEAQNPLFCAIRADQSAVVRLLAQRDDLADLMRDGATGRTALSLACERGGLQTVKALLLGAESVVHPNMADSDGKTPLCWAAEKGHDAVVEHLMSVKADVSVRTAHGRTPLHYAAESGRATVINTLLRYADANAVAEDGTSPLVAALRSGANSQDAVDLLLLHDYASLHEQVRRGNLDMVRRLLDAGYNINTKDLLGRTALHALVTAEIADQLGMAEVLLALDPKPDLTIEDTDGLTPMRLALRKSQRRLVKLFLESSAGLTRSISAKDWLQAYGDPNRDPTPIIRVQEKVGEGTEVDCLSARDFSEHFRASPNSASSGMRLLL